MYVDCIKKISIETFNKIKKFLVMRFNYMEEFRNLDIWKSTVL